MPRTRHTILHCLAVAAAGTILSFPVLAADIYYVPAAGGNWSTSGNWSLGRCPLVNDDVRIAVSGTSHKAVYYDWTGTTGFDTLTIDGNGTTYGALWQLNHSLMTDYLYLGSRGEAWHWMEGDSFLWALENIYVGYQDPGPGNFYLASEEYGVIVNGDSYVGYSGPGTFDHRNGYHMCSHLYVGQNAPGTYELKGPESTSTLSSEYHTVVGNGDVGTFEQTGGTFESTGTGGLYLGFNTGGQGTYLMKGGVLNAYRISIAWDGDGFFTQSGGVVNTDTNVIIGCDGTHPSRAWYKVNDNDGDPELLIGGDLRIGAQTLAKYEQESGGTVVIDGNIEIWKGTTDPYDSSYLYLGLNADWINAAAVINHTGYYDQDGGTMSTPSFTNDSTQGINLDNNAHLEALNLRNTAGTLWMYRNAVLRGTYAGGGVYNPCSFTNDATFQMGSASFNGGTFSGTLTNNGTFNFYQGDFSASTLVNNGTFNCNGALSCDRFVQNAYSFTLASGRSITADGTGHSSAVESNQNWTMQPRARVTITSGRPFVNNGSLYAGGSISDQTTIQGNVTNNGYLLPAPGTTDTGVLFVNGNFNATGSGRLRIRLGGLYWVSDYDQLRVTGTATLGGTLDVRLIDGFVPSAGDSFSVVTYGSRSGQFANVQLPGLPGGLEWRVNYWTSSVTLEVVEVGGCPGDLDGDGDVDLADLAQLLAHYGTTSGAAYEDGDLDEDGDVDLGDLAALLAVYGTDCP